MNTHRRIRPGTGLGKIGAAVVAIASVGLVAREPPNARADRPATTERLEREGRPPIEGSLQFDAGSGFRFESRGETTGPTTSVEAGDVISFWGNGPSPASTPPLFQIQAGETARISGALERISETGVWLRVPWRAEPVEVRRSGVLAVVQRPGESRILVDAFDSLDDSRWEVGGKPVIVSDSGPNPADHALSLPPGGASIERRFDDPPSAGRVELTFRDDGRIHPDQNWILSLTFRAPAGPAEVRVVLGCLEDSMAVESPAGPSLAVQRLARGADWQRLTVRFDADRTEIAVDGKELAHGKGPTGPLESIRLATSGPESADAGPGGLVGEIQVIRFAQPPSSLEIDPSQDEARLVVGDQLFGRVVRGDADRVEMTVDDRPTTVEWNDLAGVYLRRTPAEGSPVRGTLARIEWWSSAGAVAATASDFAEGAVTALTDSTLSLATPYAGSIQVPRARLRRIVVLQAGWRRVVDPFAHHLGNDISVTPPLLDPPHPEGGVLERSFTLPEAPPGARFLVLDVVQVVGEASGLLFSEYIQRGELKTYVELNGQRFDYLNRYIKSVNETPERIRIPIGDGLLKPGENRLRIVQTGIANNATWYDDLGILCIAVEAESAARSSPPVSAPTP